MPGAQLAFGLGSPQASGPCYPCPAWPASPALERILKERLAEVEVIAGLESMIILNQSMQRHELPL